MKDEIDAAVTFLIKIIKQNSKIGAQDLLNFQQCLMLFLTQKFHNHWHLNRPWQGQGYRCLRVNGTNRREPTIEKAASHCGIKYSDLKLPIELTVWVDPEEVCCRFGEHKGSYCTVASFKDGSKKTYFDEINLAEIEQEDVINENIFTGNTCASPVSPSVGYSDSPTKENISPLKENKCFQNTPVTSECCSRPNSLYDSASSPSNANAYRVLDRSSPFSHKQLNSMSLLHSADPGVGSDLYNRNLLSSRSPYFKPSWISYPTSISPPQPPLPSNNYYDYSPPLPPPPPHFTSQANLNRLSPINLNEVRWHSSPPYHNFGNPYTPNRWVMRRPLVGV